MKRNAFWKAFFATALLVLLAAVLWVVPAAGAEEGSPLDVAYCNLSFENEVHILYAIESNDPDVRLLVWNGTQDSYTYGTQDALGVVEARSYNINGVPHTVFAYDGLAAKQMADVVYARAYNPTTGEYGALDKYSILQYAYSMLGKTGQGTSNEALKFMLSDLLQYASSAQRFFNYKTDRPANGEWVQIQVKGGSLPDGFAQGFYLPWDTVDLYAPETIETGAVFMHWKDKNDNIVSQSPSFTLTVGYENQTYTPVYSSCNHIEVIDPAVVPTCTSTGLTEGKHCSACGEILVLQTVLEKPAHTYDENGNCTVCGLSALRFEMFSEDGENYFYQVVGIDAPALHVVIPEKYNGLSVKAIGNSAFQNHNLMTVDIPDSVNWIGNDAFKGCYNLIEIVIPNGVERIWSHAFEDCSNLERVTLPDSLRILDSRVFPGCGKLSSINLPNSLTSIGTGTFHLCGSLTSITLPEQLTHIGYYAFGSTRLTGVVIPDGVTVIEDGAFDGTFLTDIYIPESVISIGSGAFFNYTLKNVIYNGTMAQWNLISKPSDWAHMGLSFTITCTDGVLDQDGNIVSTESCAHVAVIDPAIAPTCTSTGLTEGKHCSVCEKVLVEQKTIEATGHTYDGSRCTICGEYDTLTADSAAGIAQTMVNETKAQDVEFDGYASHHNTSLDNALGVALTVIYSAGSQEEYIAALDELEVSLQTIQKEIRKEYVNSQSIPIFMTVYNHILLNYNIDHYRYVNQELCHEYLESVYAMRMPFEEDIALAIESIETKGKLDEILDHALDEMNSKYHEMEDLNEHEQSLAVFFETDDYVFRELNDGAAYQLFEAKNADGDISIPFTYNGKLVTSIGVGAFEGCTTITSVTVSVGIRSIGGAAFAGCNNLTSISIPSSVTHIGSYIFSYCSDLTSITFQGTIEQWNAIAKDPYWDSNTGTYTIHCTDGTLTKS